MQKAKTFEALFPEVSLGTRLLWKDLICLSNDTL